RAAGEDRPESSQAMLLEARLLSANALRHTDAIGAATVYRRLLADIERNGAAPAQEARVLHAQAELLMDTGSVGQARPLLERATAAFAAAPVDRRPLADNERTGAAPAQEARVLHAQAELLMATGGVGQARPLLERATELLGIPLLESPVLDAPLPATQLLDSS